MPRPFEKKKNTYASLQQFVLHTQPEHLGDIARRIADRFQVVDISAQRVWQRVDVGGCW